RCLVSHDISLRALVHFLAIPKKPIVKLPEAEDSDESGFWHLMTAGKKYAANSGQTTGFWRVVNEGPQGRQAVCYLHLPLLGSCQ
ncbi:Histidine triad nucleotide-binding protein 1, partial [Pygoscelis adeliae]